jgi:hypothetical protein
MKTLMPANTNDVIQSPEVFTQCIQSNLSYYMERSSVRVRHILQDMGQWTDNTAHEKLLLRLSCDLVERFLEYGPSQLPCRPTLLLDGFISDYFGRPQAAHTRAASNSLLYRFLDGLLNRAVLSRDALICLFYHFYGMKPVEVGFLLGLEKGQMQRIYKNFARWRQKGWSQMVEEIGLTTQELQSLEEHQGYPPERFNMQLREHLEALLPFYRKSEPPYYHCWEGQKWQDSFNEGCELDYRTWHLPLCLGCMQTIVRFGEPSLKSKLMLHLHIVPHSLKEEEQLERFGNSSKVFPAKRSPQHVSQVLQPV